MHAAPESRPYSGDFNGTTWNPRAFFARDDLKMQRRVRKVEHFLQYSDFVALQETHSSPERVTAFNQIFQDRVRHFWSHCTQGKGGIGLLINASFLNRFAEYEWEELQTGRLAVLHLRGRDGALDIFVCYLDPHSSTERRITFQRISSTISPKAKVLSLLCGDFNFVPSREDRICKTSMAFTGQRDTNEHERFRRQVLMPAGMHELQQDEYTFAGGTAHARLDRAYTNMHVANQLDSVLVCCALEWCKHLSDHRPVRFGRVGRQHKRNRDAGVPAWTVEHEHWPDWVWEDFNRRRGAHGHASKFILLDDLKAAMRFASEQVRKSATSKVATSVADQLAAAMGMLRAAESRNVHAAMRCAEAYPLLAEYVNPAGDDLRLQAGMERIRDLAIDLATQDLLSHEASLSESGLPDHVRRCRKEHLDKRFKRLLPGSTCSLQGLLDDCGEFTTDPERMAQILTKHWGDVLSHKPVDEDLLSSWLQDVTDKLPDPDEPVWQLLRQHMDDAIKFAHETAPGPDGIPYRAFKRFPGSSDVLYEAAVEMLKGDGDRPGAAFNYAFLCCLPKKPVRTDPLLGHLYDAKHTRPLSLVNTDNRLIASAFRIALEPILNSWVSSMQRGFLKDRSMLANIVDVDFHSMRISMNHPHGALLLFDFEAAFPSLSQEYMWRVLAHIGVPAAWVMAIKLRYVDNKHFIRLGGSTHPSFTTSSGVRQGCPLSPLLFAVVADVLLRRLARLLPTSVVRAFADDTAMVVESFHAAAATVFAAFKEFSKISCLKLNLPKTVLIPLWPSTVDSVRRMLRAQYPEWSAVDISYASRYLGFLVGPEAGELAWEKPVTKFNSRCKQWSALHLGMQYSCRVYKVFCVSVLSFLLQLTDLPDGMKRHEDAALRLFAPGPGNWVTPTDLFCLQQWYGFPYAFPSLEILAVAAKLRVRTHDIADFDAKRLQLLEDIAFAPCRHPQWQKWYKGSYILRIHAAVCAAAAKGASLEIASKHAQLTQDTNGRYNLQRTACDLLLQHQNDNAENRVRAKLQRWKLQDPPGYVARRAIRRLSTAFSLVAPRVAVVLFGTLWNRWCTARRFQEDGTCIFGCPGEAQDSIEHYSRCPRQIDFALRKMHLPPQHVGSLQAFMVLNKNIDDDLQTMLMINLYACYATRNALKHHQDPDSCRNIGECMLQFAKQAVYGHPKSRSVFARWIKVPFASSSSSARGARSSEQPRWVSGGELGPWPQ